VIADLDFPRIIFRGEGGKKRGFGRGKKRGEEGNFPEVKKKERGGKKNAIFHGCCVIPF